MAVRHAVVNATEQSSCCCWVALHLASSLKHYGSASQFFRRLTKQLLLLLKQGFALAKKTTLPSGLCWLPFHDDWGGIFKSLEKQKHMDIKGGRGKLKFAVTPGHYPRSLPSRTHHQEKFILNSKFFDFWMVETKEFILFHYCFDWQRKRYSFFAGKSAFTL